MLNPSSKMFDMVLNMPWVLSEYGKVLIWQHSQYARVTQRSEYARVRVYLERVRNISGIPNLIGY